MQKPEIIMIAAMTANHAIGKGNNELAVISKADMAHFKETTMGHPVIMGRKTFESMNNFLLPGRFNYILSRDEQKSLVIKFRKSDTDQNILTRMGFGTFEDSLEALSNPLSKIQDTGKTFIIGGGEIYEKFMSLADKLILTVYPIEIPATTFFPKIQESIWELESEVPLMNSDNHQEGLIKTYIRKKSNF